MIGYCPAVTSRPPPPLPPDLRTPATRLSPFTTFHRCVASFYGTAERRPNDFKAFASGTGGVGVAGEGAIGAGDKNVITEQT
ncbi:hypothetical protein EVAR_27986_1 [Eumeta japonica]|uniref:Uncharacterized protein n=1 Tax=Eumeta variegata TaxID=151549 RepID=A0A4C1WCH2_EUMVA|nr:hypothetical protein EVAR_27986_1 [Eumeta japonica]